jgi:sugar lactone lactonase YvrE
MLFRKHIVSTRTLLKVAVAMIFPVATVGAAFAANNGIAPLLVPYTIQTIAGTPQFAGTTTSVPVGYFGEGTLAAPTLANHPTGATTVMNAPFAMAVDSVGNVYIADTSNYIIREVNAQTGLISTIAGVVPKGCSGASCSVRVNGCADGAPAAGSPIGSKIEGIAVDSYGNVYFADATTVTVSVIYRGGTRVADFINRVNPGGVAASGGTVQPGYVYHIAGAINPTGCSPLKGNADNGLAFTNLAVSPTATATFGNATNFFFVTLDSAGNIYVSDSGNTTTRVINTQETPQTFFQFTVQPGYMRSIMGCSAALTVPCPTVATTPVLNTGIYGPADAVVFNSQWKSSQVDAFGNVYQLNGTGSGTGPPGIYAATAYAGGSPLTTLIQAESPLLAGTYGPNSANPGNTPAALNAAGLPTYGNTYPTLNNPSLNSTLPGQSAGFPDILPPTTNQFDIRPSGLGADSFGTLWFIDNHFPELHRIDQYTSLATMVLHGDSRATANINPLNASPAFWTNPYYCVYGNVGSKVAWTQGPQTYDPQGDGCPSVTATFAGGNQTVSDGLANLYVGDTSENLMREILVGNYFPATAVGTTKPITQAIQVHFNSNNPPALGAAIPDGPVVGNTTTAFSIAPGIPDFTIDTTDPQFPMGALIGSSPYNNSTLTANFQMWAGLPTCTQLGVYPTSTPVTDLDCLVYVTFNPTAPGVRQSQLVVTTANGSVYNFALYGVGTGGQLAIDGGTASQAFTGSGAYAAVALNSAGTMYLADPTNNQIVVKPAGNGPQTVLSFTGVTPATLSGPMGVALDTANNVYISDTGNNRILKVNPITNVATVLGNYVWIPGASCYNASGNLPTCPTTTPAGVTPTTAPPQYAFNHPQGIAVDSWNNVYVADTGNKAVVMIPSNLQMGGATPFLQYPNAPKFSVPVAVAVDSQGNIYVADNKSPGGVIVILPPGGGDLVTVPGASFPKTKGANLTSPNGVAVDAAGNIYASDSATNQVVEIPAASGASGTPFALNLPGLSAPAGVALDANGNLYVADSGNKQILVDNRQNPVVNFGTVPQNAGPFGVSGYVGNPPVAAPCPVAGSSTPCTGVLKVTNIGTAPINLTSPITAVSGAGNPAYKTPDNCTSPLLPGATCTISPTFSPTADNQQMETVNVNGGPQTLSLIATGEQPLVSIALSAAYSVGTTPSAGATATITATVTQPNIAVTPTGTVTFTYTINANNNNANSCGSGGTQTVNLVNGTASFQLPVLAQGVQYTVNATYNGDGLNSVTKATPLVIFVPGIPVTATVTSTANQLTFTYGQAAPAINGTVTPTPASPVTFSFGSAAKATTPIGSYPVVVSFSGTGSCAYGFPPSVFSTGGPALVTENPAPLSYKLPNFTSLYGAQPLTYGAGVNAVGGVNGDSFSATFVPPDSSILNVGTYSVVPTVTGPQAGNYTVTAPPSTLTITPAPVAISVSAAKTQVLNTAAGVASATFGLSVSSTVPSGKGIPSGSVTVTDNFTPITSTGLGAPAAPTTTVVPLVAGFGTYIPTSTVSGMHQYSFAYSGDSNFQTASVVPNPTGPACTPAAPTTNCLVVDTPDFTLTSLTGTILINPGTVPSGNGLPVAPNQSTAYPESAALFINSILSFTGSVTLSCTTQNPTYVNCFMTPTTVCFASTSTAACTNTAATAATVLAVETPANLPLGFFGQTRVSATKTVLAFLPFGVLAFCVRRRRRLSKALWMLITIAAIGAGMSGCGGNQVAFYTPVPTGAQSVTVTASYGTGASQTTRTYVVPILIE